MENRQYKTKELFGRFLPYFKPYWKTMVDHPVRAGSADDHAFHHK